MAETPWSVKGVDRKAREAAKRAAHAEGRTLGAWLSEAILNGWAAADAAADRTPAVRSDAGDRTLERRIDALERKQVALAQDTLSAMMILRTELREAKASAETQEACRALGEAAGAFEKASRAAPSRTPPADWDAGLRDMIAGAKARLDGLEREMRAVRERSGPPAVFEPPPRRRDMGAFVFIAALILGGVFVSALAAVVLAGRA